MANILFIASGFPPFEFSENIINGKLVLALMKKGHSVRVISKIDEGQTYNSEWREPWLILKPVTYYVSYAHGSLARRSFEIIMNTLRFKYPQEGIRWSGYAFRKAIELIKGEGFDVVITRSPSDIAHLVGLRLKRKLNIRWIANFNDPTTGIWPYPYEKNFPCWKRSISKKFVQEVLKLADITSFPSRLLAEHFKEHFKLYDNRVSIIPHIMLEESLEVGYKTNPGNLHIIHSGNLSPERDPEKLLLALRKYNTLNEGKFYLDIMGVISDKWMKQIEKLGQREYVNTIEPLPYYEAMHKMVNYDVLLILEAPLGKGIFLPSKIADYAQLKKPILAISPAIGEVKNLLEKYGGGISANNNSVDDIFEKLSFLSREKAESKLIEITSNSTLREYLDEKRVINLLESNM
jgi:glycosyltransferase involved in cell wall biosynthesis